MKTQILRGVGFGLLALAMAIPAVGQTHNLKVKIPIDFMLGEKQYPAGQYTFSPERDTIVMAQVDGQRLARLLTNHASGRSGGNTGQLVLQCYERQCFVSQIWVSGQDDGRELMRSRLEKEVATTKTGRYMVLLGNAGLR